MIIAIIAGAVVGAVFAGLSFVFGWQLGYRRGRAEGYEGGFWANPAAMQGKSEIADLPALPRKIRSDSHAQLCIPILQAANRMVNERDLFVQTGIAQRKGLTSGSPQYKSAQRGLRSLLVGMADAGRTFIYHHAASGDYYFQLIGFEQKPDDSPEPDPRDALADVRSEAENDAWLTGGE